MFEKKQLEIFKILTLYRNLKKSLFRRKLYLKYSFKWLSYSKFDEEYDFSIKNY